MRTPPSDNRSTLRCRLGPENLAAPFAPSAPARERYRGSRQCLASLGQGHWKRQDSANRAPAHADRHLPLASSPTWTDTDPLPIYIGPVSYTHLDVYKRQPMNCARAARRRVLCAALLLFVLISLGAKGAFASAAQLSALTCNQSTYTGSGTCLLYTSSLNRNNLLSYPQTIPRSVPFESFRSISLQHGSFGTLAVSQQRRPKARKGGPDSEPCL